MASAMRVCGCVLVVIDFDLAHHAKTTDVIAIDGLARETRPYYAGKSLSMMLQGSTGRTILNGLGEGARRLRLSFLALSGYRDYWHTCQKPTWKAMRDSTELPTTM
jgi:hypothetical protein